MNTIPELIRNTKSPCNYPEKWAWLEETGKKTYNSKFKLFESDAKIILMLMIWSLRDKKLANKYQLDLSKGIFLKGPVGCGKTSLMRLISIALKDEPIYFRLKSSREIAFEFANDGYELFTKYFGKNIGYGLNSTGHICFDDLGLEKGMVHYGSSCNVMEEILLSRYDAFFDQKVITHVTTNLTSKQIEERYGVRVRSRCRMMFNVIAFGKDTPDKRF